MARLIRDGAVKGGKSEAVKDAQRKPPSKSFLILGKDFVQIIAKDVLLSGDTVPNGRARENRAEIVTDAVLSQVPHRELERELMPWKPDDDASENLSLNFSHTWRLLSFIVLCFSILMRERYIYSSLCWVISLIYLAFKSIVCCQCQPGNLHLLCVVLLSSPKS
jgi:hypothetical protein